MRRFWRRLRGIPRSPSAVAFGRFTGVALSLFTAPLSARALGPEGRGVTASVLAVFVILPTLLQMGVPLVARRKIVTGVDASTIVRTARIYGVLTILPALVLSGAIYVLLFRGLSPFESAGFFALALAVPCAVNMHIDQSVLIAFRRYLAAGVVAASQTGVAFVVVVTMFALDRLTVATVLFATCGSYVGSCVLAWRFTRRVARGGRVDGLRAMAKEGSTLLGGQLSNVTARRGDQVLALPVLGAQAAGYYSIAVTVSSLLFPVMQAFGNAKFHNIAASENRSEVPGAVREVVALAISGAAGLMLAGPILIPIVFGSEFRSSVPVFLVAVVGSSLSGIANVFVQFLAARLRGSSASVAQVVGLVVSLVLFVPAASWFGAAGAALAMAVGAGVSAVMQIRSLKVPMGGIVPRPRDFVGALRSLFGAAS